MFEACKRISPEFNTDDYSCVITRCRKRAASLPYLADIKHNSIVEGSSVFTIVHGADCKMDCLNTTGPLSPQTLPLKAGNIFTISKESLYHWTLGCTKIWQFHQKVTEPSQKLGLTIRRKYANF